ncbi:LysR family transcriptional regulator [uncultured Anaerotruncus sp.]|uniref:LysR family transcriptional regulator n=2 Tax=Oscillospiraceae TaxID=216572 RepID=UPI00208C0F86|nr:LysR family transcriptional regulator [uncultured Anaerotruncus sp.]GKH47982.1 LysR family transcriptional regulator [Oscillospiraceae bacterium]
MKESAFNRRRGGLCMDILRLRYFRAVAQTENISQAAEKLLISQPALSKAISLLEDEVGVALFQRSGRRIALNEYGHAFLKYAELAIDAVDRGVSAVREIENPSTAPIRLQTNITGELYLIELIRSFRRAHPGATFEVIKNYTKSKFLYDCDLYIHAVNIPLNKCASLPLFTEELVLGVPAGHPLAAYDHIPLRMARNEEFIGLIRSTSWTEETNGFCFQAGFKPNVVYTCDGTEMVAKLIAAGEGVGFLAAQSWGAFPEGVKLLHLDDPLCSRSYNLSWQIDKPFTPLAEQFREHILAYFKARKAPPRQPR